MLKLSGPCALSNFRINKLLAEIQLVEPSIKAVSARFIHFIDVAEDLDDQQLNILDRLLSYGDGQVL